MEEYTYEAEVLPEIEIREIMSLEELLASNTSFVAFSESEILQYLTQLVQDSSRGKVFNDLFQKLRSIHEVPHPSIEYVVPILDTEVEPLEEDSHITIVESIAATSTAPNYISQLNEIYKVTYPLTIKQNAPKPHLESAAPVTVGLERGATKRYVLLPRDISHAAYTLSGVAYRAPVTTHSSYVYERTAVQEIQPFPKNEDIAFGKLPKDVIPSFKAVVEGITHLIDTHTLRVYLERYGYDLERLSEEDLQILITKLKAVPTDEQEQEKNDRETRVDAVKFGTLASKSGFWNAFENMLQQRVDQDKFQLMWEMLPSTTQLVAPAVQVPNDIADIALGVAENRFTMEEVVASLKYTRALAEYQQVRELLESYQALDMESIKEKLASLRDRWEAITTSYVDRMPNEFLETYRDIAEIKEGTDTSTYLGDPQRVYYEEAANNGDAMDANDEDEDVAADEVDMMIEPLPVSLHGYSEGCREILEHVLPIVQRIQQASGVPCHYEALAQHLSSKIVRTSRKEYIDTNVVGLSSQLRTQLVHMDLERALHAASMVIPVELSAQLKQVIQIAWKAWEDDLSSITYEALAWWVLDTQEKALNRALEFDATQGSFACMQKWSPWGPPLQADKSEGVLEYLVCVAIDIDAVPGTVDTLKRHVMQSIEDDPRVETLKSRFKDMGKDAPVMTDRAKAANMSLAEAIENKQKSRYLPEFVKTYMLLPGLLAGQQPKMATGCCLQKIGADFKADSDWRGTLKRLRDVKDAFAKKRMTVLEMPYMALFEVAQSDEDLMDTHATTYILPTVDAQTLLHLENWLVEWDTTNVTFLSKPMLQTVLKDMNQAMAQAEKNFKMAKATAKIKLDVFEFLKERASWVHFEQLFNIVVRNIQSTRAKVSAEGREHALLTSYVSELVEIKRYLHKLRGILDEVDMSLVRPLYTFIISRAVCLPAVPESSTGSQLVITESVGAGFLSRTIKTGLEQFKNYIQTATMPTMDQQATFITDMREQQKVDVLAVLDDKSVDDRQLLLDMKKLGLISLVKKPVAEPQPDDTGVNTTNDDEYEAEGEDEFKHKGTDADKDDLDDMDE